MEKRTYYVVINLQNFDVDLYKFKKNIANTIGCHENSLKDLNERRVIKNYLIVSVKA